MALDQFCERDEPASTDKQKTLVSEESNLLRKMKTHTLYLLAYVVRFWSPEQAKYPCRLRSVGKRGGQGGLRRMKIDDLSILPFSSSPCV